MIWNFCYIIGRNICDTNTVEKEVVVHVTNTDANKTVINESSCIVEKLEAMVHATNSEVNKTMINESSCIVEKLEAMVHATNSEVNETVINESSCIVEKLEAMVHATNSEVNETVINESSCIVEKLEAMVHATNSEVNETVINESSCIVEKLEAMVHATNSEVNETVINESSCIVEKLEAMVHATNSEVNKTVINESSETKERIISLKIKKGNEFPHISEMKSQLYTKTAMMLQITLSQEKELINKFDTQRAKLKHNSGHNQSLIDDYMDLIAQIEVKLINKEMDLKEELGRLEREQWEKDDSLNLIPKEATKRKYYDDIITNLKRIKILRNELNI